MRFGKSPNFILSFFVILLFQFVPASLTTSQGASQLSRLATYSAMKIGTMIGTRKLISTPVMKPYVTA